MERAIILLGTEQIEVSRAGTDVYTSRPVTQAELDKIISILDESALV
jgi:hypothetical protein